MDKIQHAYGWTDEVVLEVTLKRAVQMKEAIEQRMAFKSWEEKKLIEWQTRSISAMLVNTAETTKEGRVELMRFVESMSLTGDGKTSKKSATAPRRKTYRTVDGKEISASEINQYTYDEIDHTEENARIAEAARQRNVGKNIASLGFTR